MAATQPIAQIIKTYSAQIVKDLYSIEVNPESVTLNLTRKEFEGDYTVVVFPWTSAARKKPEMLAEEIGQKMLTFPEISGFNVVKGFLNLVVSDAFWKNFLLENVGNESYGNLPSNGRKVMVEFSSPNTNKPLHLGHIRNNLLGWSESCILQAAGYEVIKANLINDRGVHICKSMLAWQKFGEGATPASRNMKGDHLVGEYYVRFETEFQKEFAAWKAIAGNDSEIASNDYFNNHSELGRGVKEMLRQWEAKDPEVRKLWEMMNGWVYEGFEETYNSLGISFDKVYHESETYILGKDMIEKGLEKDVFYKKDDGSIWCDLEDINLDHKLVLRSDGTSVYMTQDIGTAHLKYEDFKIDESIYVVGNEQDYHFKVLFEILKRLEEPYAPGLFHLSYGMVNLPHGRMKSREGTVVDADDLIAEVIQEARNTRLEREEKGEIDPLPKEEVEKISRGIGLAAIKFHLLKVNPKKTMVFDPTEAIDMQGHTGPYILNAYVRSASIARKAGAEPTISETAAYSELHPAEREMLRQIALLPDTIAAAAAQHDPAGIADYAYQLAKLYHRFFHDVRVLGAESEAARAFRLLLSSLLRKVLAKSMKLLGIEMVDRM